MSKIHLIATCAFGVEAIVGKELKKLGYDDQFIENGRVTFAGDESAICRSNLWLRTAERVLLKIGEFNAVTFDELFEGTKALPWDAWIPGNAEFPVDATSIDSKLFSVSDIQSIVKKAVVDKLKSKYKTEWFEETGPRYKIEAALLKDRVTLSIDTSGVGLHKRGYRKLVAQAPLKETLAAAMIQISWWREDRVLLDPFCGSGTIPIEAALIGRNIAPGINRGFVSEKWRSIPGDAWEKAKQEAFDSIKRDTRLMIRGSDIDDEVLSLARYHLKTAGVEQDVHLQRMPMSEIKSSYKYGFIICNPPYGERLGEMKEVEKLYRDMGIVFQKLDTWSYYILTSHMGFEKLFGKSANKKRKLYNGMIMCNYYQFFGPPPRRKPAGDNVNKAVEE